MKFMFFLIVVVCLVLGGVYMAGSDFDPDKQGQELKASIVPGMSWQEVAAKKEPRKFQGMRETEVDGVPMIRATGEQKFPGVGSFEKWSAQGQMDHGFIFIYHFTDKVAFNVHFDGEGKVESVTDRMTMADLLHTR